MEGTGKKVGVERKKENGKRERMRKRRQEGEGEERKLYMATELETPGSLPGLGGDRAHQSASPRPLSVSPSNR